MNKKGFTLIELLIVITIIGILAVALLPRLLEGPKLARDTQRKATLNTLATKLQIYSNDNGVYPEDNADAGSGECPTDNKGDIKAASKLAKALVDGNYLTSIDFPKDPQPTNANLCGAAARSYWYNAVSDNEVDLAGFVIAADVEVDKQANSKADEIENVDSIEDYVTAMQGPAKPTATDKGSQTVLSISSR